MLEKFTPFTVITLNLVVVMVAVVVRETEYQHPVNNK